MKQLRACYMTFFAFLLFLTSSTRLSGQTDLYAKIATLSEVVETRPLESNEFIEKYVISFTQPLDHRHPEQGTFGQRVIVAHVGFDRPTILVTEGYGATYALRPQYREELSKHFNANIVFVEHRYFLESTPKPKNYRYLTAENSAYDLHRITTAFRTIYPGKWLATGISKGGQTALLYRAYFPDDVEITVPYVAPLCQGAEDGRHEPFLHKVSTAKNRRVIESFQFEVLKRKGKLLPRLAAYCEEKGYEFRAPIEEIYDYCVLEYAFSLWQWGTSLGDIPPSSASDEVVFQHFLAISDPSYFAKESLNTSFFVQAGRELGYYGYDTAPFEKYLSIDSSKGYLARLLLPQELKGMTFDKTLGQKVTAFLKANDPKMIFIYGQNDPWTAAGVTWLKGKKNMKVFIQPGGSHRTRISTLPEAMKRQALALIGKWLDE